MGKDKPWAYAIGTGIALSPIHNLWLTNLMTNSRGETLFFLPAFGYLILIMGTGLYLVRCKDLGLGDKNIWLPMTIIIIAMGISGIAAEGLEQKLAPLFAGACFFGVYLAGQRLSKDIFVPLAIGAAVASVGIIISAVLEPGLPTGGILFNNKENILAGNYDIATGYIVLGSMLYQGQFRKQLMMLMLIALFLSGSPEGFIAIAVIAAGMTVLRKWNKEVIMIVAPAAVIAGLWFTLGYGQQLYSFLLETITLQSRHTLAEYPGIDPARLSDLDYSAVGYRLAIIKHALTNIKPLGEGYILTDFSRIKNVHNVPLVLIQQLGYTGIAAAAAWLWATVYLLIKTKWKLAWIASLSLCIFDHYIWTQLAPVWWALAGVSLCPKRVFDSVLLRIKRIKELMLREIDEAA